MDIRIRETSTVRLKVDRPKHTPDPGRVHRSAHEPLGENRMTRGDVNGYIYL